MKNILFSSIISVALSLMVASTTSFAGDTAGKCGAGKCGSTTKVEKPATSKCGSGKEVNATNGLGVGKCGTGMQGKCGVGKCGSKIKAEGMKCGTGKCGGSK